jgi:hypothetical protein
MFIPLKMVLIGIYPYPHEPCTSLAGAPQVLLLGFASAHYRVYREGIIPRMVRGL